MATIAVFGVLLILTLFTPLPHIKYFLFGAAIFQAGIVMFAGVVGVMGLTGELPKWRYRSLMGVAFVFALFAWWVAAEQSARDDAIQRRLESSVDLMARPKGVLLENGEWLVKAQIHITGSIAQTGVVLRFYGSKVKSLKVIPKYEQRGGNELYRDDGKHYAHYINYPIAIYGLEIKFAERGPIRFTYKFEDGRPESEPVTWEVDE